MLRDAMMMGVQGSEIRHTAKVLLVDRLGRVLLFKGFDRTMLDTPPWWFAVGGALEADEDVRAAAIREAFEETGLRIGDPGAVVLTRRFDWEFEGSRYNQEETYFLVRTNAFTPTSEGWSETELATMLDHKWWSIDELRATTEIVYPEGLADLLESLT